jgi:hypothetical protein
MLDILYKLFAHTKDPKPAACILPGCGFAGYSQAAVMAEFTILLYREHAKHVPPAARLHNQSAGRQPDMCSRAGGQRTST